MPWSPTPVVTPPEAHVHRTKVARAVAALISFGAVPAERAEGAYDAMALFADEALDRFTAKLEAALEARRKAAR